MESLTILAVSFFMCVLAVLFYLQAERNAYKAVLENVKSVQADICKVKSSYEASKTRVDDLVNSFVTNQKSIRSDIDQVQDHCARLREQQQKLYKRQSFLKEKMIPSKVEFTLVEKTKPAIPTKLLNKINSQLDILNAAK